MGDKTCNRCGKRGLGWDFKFYKQMKKWKLENHKKEDGKWCNKPFETLMMRKKEDLTLCKLCENSSFGLVLKTELEDHIRINHKNGRSVSDLDYMMEAHPKTTLLKNWRHDKNYHRYKHLDKDRFI